MDLLAGIAKHCTEYRTAASGTSLLLIGFLVQQMLTKGKRRIRERFVEAQVESRAEARRKIAKGLNLSPASTDDEQEDAVDAFVEGIDQWRQLVAQRTRWNRLVKLIEALIIVLAVLAVAMWACRALDQSARMEAVLLLVWFVGFVLVWALAWPIYKALSERGDPPAPPAGIT